LLDTPTKINFYDFKCQGFKYQSIKFKQLHLKQFCETLDVVGGDFADMWGGYTYGAYALKILKKLIAEKQVMPISAETIIKRRLRQAYTGGRNEYIQDPKPGARLYSIDFNLMYFNCLKTDFLMNKLFIKQTQQFEGAGFYYVRYEGHFKNYPVLYYYNKFTEHNYFCNGVGEGLF